eukprot:UN26991
MVRSNSQCTDATMANVDTTNGGSHFGTCWCQWGSSMITDNDSCCQTTWIDDDCTAADCVDVDDFMQNGNPSGLTCADAWAQVSQFLPSCPGPLAVQCPQTCGTCPEASSQPLETTAPETTSSTSSDRSACTWVQSNAITDGEILVGFVNSLDECINMVRSNSECTDATMANVDTTNGGSYFGSCWCQWGSSMITDNDSCCQTTWIDNDCTATGYEGSLCKVNDDCDSARCNFSEFPSRCRKKESHLSDCDRDVDCQSEHCLGRKCVDGRDNDRCNSNDDCQSGRCAFGVPFGKCQT